MSLKRRKAKTDPHRITPEAVEAFRAGDDDALRQALSLRPWQWPTLPPLDEACPDPPGTAGADWWLLGQEIHRKLAAAPPLFRGIHQLG